MSSKIRQKLPVVPPQQAPCEECDAMCCRYFALEIDAPEDADDFEDLRWYLLHENSWIWVENDEWFLQIDQQCRYLGKDNRCQIYETRPKICREYGVPEFLDNPKDPLCDYFVQGVEHDLEFRDAEALGRWGEKFLVEKAAQRARRSRAAKKGWARRRS